MGLDGAVEIEKSRILAAKNAKSAENEPDERERKGY